MCKIELTETLIKLILNKNTKPSTQVETIF